MWSPRAAGWTPGGAPPPLSFAERPAERRGQRAPAWRLTDEPLTHRIDRPLSWLLRNPVRRFATVLTSVAALSVVALVAGPEVGCT